MSTEICDPSTISSIAADRIAQAMIAAIAKDGAVSLGLSGGTTPRATYEALARAPGIDWQHVIIHFADERAVPPDHPESNFGMAQATLLSRVPLTPANVHRMHADADDLDAAARAYDGVLPHGISILVLGIGEDGHTASLFPGSSALDERERRVLSVVGPKPPPQRLTITPPVIEAAGLCVMIATGAGKADAIARALQGPVDIHRTPASLARNGLWLLDQAAASKLDAQG